jgi:hypothetical protein
MESQLQPISQSETQERSGSTVLIKEWLFRFGVEHKEDVAPRLPLWLEAFGEMDTTTLERLFEQALKTCKFFPKIAEILAPLENSPAPKAEADLKWTRVLDYIRVYFNPDMPGGVSRGAPRITERTATAIRAAGGLAWIADCPLDDLQWAKKRFVESYTAWETLKRDEYLLPDDSPIKALLSGAWKALPPPRVVIAEPERYAELAKQAAEMVAKYGTEGNRP